MLRKEEGWGFFVFFLLCLEQNNDDGEKSRSPVGSWGWGGGERLIR